MSECVSERRTNGGRYGWREGGTKERFCNNLNQQN